MQKLSAELCSCRKELETQTTALKRATHAREELAKDKAALDVKLNSADRKACGLMQELVALRSVWLCMCVTSKMCGSNQFSQFFSFFFYVFFICHRTFKFGLGLHLLWLRLG